MTEVSGEDLSNRLATRAVHAGKIADPLAGAVMTPIYQTSTYVQEGLGRHKGYEYARTRNPTREALERNVAALEGGRHGFAFGSGLGALDAVMKLLSAGDHVVCGENVYGGTHRQMTHIWARLGLAFTFVDTADPQRIVDAVTPATRMIFVETPTNPLMRLCDLAATGAIARRAERPRAPALPRSARPGGACVSSRPAVPPPARARVPADERVRRHGEPRAGHARAGAPLRRAHQDLRARRIAGRGREPGGPSCVDDARERAPGDARGDGADRQPRAALDRHRGRRGSDRGPRSSARMRPGCGMRDGGCEMRETTKHVRALSVRQTRDENRRISHLASRNS